MMTRSLEKAFDEASKLSAEEQEAFAAWMLEELSELRGEAGNDPAMTLRELLDEARKDYREGRTHPLEPDHFANLAQSVV